MVLDQLLIDDQVITPVLLTVIEITISVTIELHQVQEILNFKNKRKIIDLFVIFLSEVIVTVLFLDLAPI